MLSPLRYLRADKIQVARGKANGQYKEGNLWQIRAEFLCGTTLKFWVALLESVISYSEVIKRPLFLNKEKTNKITSIYLCVQIYMCLCTSNHISLIVPSPSPLLRTSFFLGCLNVVALNKTQGVMQSWIMFLPCIRIKMVNRLKIPWDL